MTNMYEHNMNIVHSMNICTGTVHMTMKANDSSRT